MWQIYRRTLVAGIFSLILLTGCTTATRQQEPHPNATAVVVPERVQQDFDAALAALARGDDAAAIEKFEAFIDQYPDYATAYVNLAIAYERQKQVEQALWLLNKAVEIDPTAVEALNRLGTIHRRQGKLAAAEAYWRQAVVVDPSYPNAWYNLGVLCELYKQDIPAALENYRRYQAITNGADADPVVARWIEDLERRAAVPVQAANTSGAL